MYATKDQIIGGVYQYINSELLAANTNMKQGMRMIAKIAVTAYALKIGVYIDRFASIPANASIGMVDQSGRIDLDAFATAARKCMQESPDDFRISSPVGEWRFDSSDVDKLLEYISKSGSKSVS